MSCDIFIFQISHADGPVHLKINLVYCVILFLSNNSLLVKKVRNMDLSWEFAHILRTATPYNVLGQLLLLDITIWSIPISIPVCDHLFQKRKWKHSLGDVLRKKCSQKIHKNQRKTPASESLFLKKLQTECIFLWSFQNLKEHHLFNRVC